MKKIFYLFNLILVFICLYSFNFKLYAENNDNYIIFDNDNDFLNYIENNLSEISKSYKKYTNSSWNITTVDSVKQVNVCGSDISNYLISFNIGYILTNRKFELLDFNTTKTIDINVEDDVFFYSGYYYKRVDDTYIPLTNDTFMSELDYYSLFDDSIYYNYESLKNSLEITESYSLDIKNKNGIYGDSDVITGYQGNEYDCGAQAALNYIFTLDKTYSTNLSKSDSFLTEISTMHTYMNYPKTGSFKGIWPWELKDGFKYYTNRELTSSANNDLCIGLYSNLNMGNTAHYALCVGIARKKAWWFFYTYYDLISTWHANFDTNITEEKYRNNVLNKDHSYFDNYYFVKRSYALNYWKVK